MRNASLPAGKSGDALPHPSSANRSRRRFLFALGATSAGAAAAPALAVAPDAVATSVASQTSGYRETDHVRDYYDSARI